MIKDRDMIRELQKANLVCLQKLDEICKRHNIKYWVAYGTLIGTIRHKGFVPWDDDLDVCMLREDYEKLKKVPAAEWGDKCMLGTARSDDERHDKMFGRVYRKDCRIQSYKDVRQWKNISDGKSWSTSPMCDIFLFDRVPDDDEQVRKLYKKILYGYALKRYPLTKLKACAENGSVKDKLKAFVKNCYGGLMRTLYVKPWRHLDKVCEKMVARTTPGSRIGTYYCSDPYLYEYDEVFPLQTAVFEGMEVPIPKCWDKMLTDMYGNYMQFPPEEERYHLDLIYVLLDGNREYIIDKVKGSLGDK